MEIKKLLKRASVVTCIYFTVIMVCFMSILYFMNTDKAVPATEASKVIFFFLASILFAIANLIRKADKIHPVLKVVAHYIICTVSVLLFILLPMNFPQNSHYITGIVLFSIAYFLVRIITWAFSSKLKKNLEIEEAYQKQFSNSKKKKK